MYSVFAFSSLNRLCASLAPVMEADVVVSGACAGLPAL
jgi:hypothetical protein